MHLMEVKSLVDFDAYMYMYYKFVYEISFKMIRMWS